MKTMMIDGEWVRQMMTFACCSKWVADWVFCASRVTTFACFGGEFRVPGTWWRLLTAVWVTVITFTCFGSTWMWIFTSLVMCAGYLVTLTAKLPHFVWIGLNDMKRRNYFEWQDNSEVDFTHWGPQQPDENVHSSNPDDRVGLGTLKKSYRKFQTTLLSWEFLKLTSFFSSCFSLHWLPKDSFTNTIQTRFSVLLPQFDRCWLLVWTLWSLQINPPAALFSWYFHSLCADAFG